MIYGYIRVSTDTQTVENQKMVILEYANYHRMDGLEFVSETISGTKTPDKRKLGGLIEKTNSGDTIIVTELSRLGRSMTMVLTMKNFVTVNIYVKELPPLEIEPKRHGHPMRREIEYFKTHIFDI